MWYKAGVLKCISFFMQKDFGVDCDSSSLRKMPCHFNLNSLYTSPFCCGLLFIYSKKEFD